MVDQGSAELVNALKVLIMLNTVFFIVKMKLLEKNAVELPCYGQRDPTSYPS